jgi:hypothetical protein
MPVDKLPPDRSYSVAEIEKQIWFIENGFPVADIDEILAILEIYGPANLLARLRDALAKRNKPMPPGVGF